MNCKEFVKSESLANIFEICQREIKMQSNFSLPLAKSNYSSVKSAYIKFAFAEN